MATTVFIRPYRMILKKGDLVNSLGPPAGPGEKLSVGATTGRNTTAFPAGTDAIGVTNKGTNYVLVEVGPADTVVASATTSTPCPPGVTVFIPASSTQKIALIEE